MRVVVSSQYLLELAVNMSSHLLSPLVLLCFISPVIGKIALWNTEGTQNVNVAESGWEKLHLQTGLVFLPLNDFYLSNAAWKVYLTVPYDPLCLHVQNVYNEIQNKTNAFFNSIGNKTEVEGWKTYFQHSAQSLVRTFQTCASIQSLHGHSRQKRALIDVGGKLLHSLFGVSTDQELSEVKTDLETVRAAMKNYSSVEAKQLTLINETWTRVTEDHQRVKFLTEGFIKIRGQDTAIMKQVNSALSEERGILQHVLASELVNSATRLTQEIRQQIEKIEAILVAAANNVLHIELLGPTELNKILQEVEQKLPGGFELLLPIATPHLYYQENILQSFSTEDGFAFLLKIPLRSASTGFHLYLAKPLAVPLKNSTLYAFVHSTPPYFAISQDRETYLELNHEDLDQCTQGPIKLCATLSPIRHKDSPSCLAALFFGRQDEIHSQCPRMIVQNPEPMATRIPNSNQWYISLPKASKMKLSCPNIGKDRYSGRSSTQMTGIVRVSVPNYCTMEGPGFDLPVQFTGSTHISWNNFSLLDVKEEVESLFSTRDMHFLSEKPNITKDIQPSPTPNLVHRILNDTLARYDKRPADLDNLRAQLESTDAKLFTKSSHLAYHVKKPSTWFPVLLTLAILSISYAVVRVVLWVRTRWQNAPVFFSNRRRRHPNMLRTPPEEEPEARELAPISLSHF